MMVWASALGVLFTVLGLWLSYAWDLTSGASIIVVAGVGYLVSLGVRPIARRVAARPET
jgi:zinc transport system permease protein